MNCNGHYFHRDKKHASANNVNVILCVKYKHTWCYALKKTKNPSCEKMSNGKLHSKYYLCTKTDNDITKVPAFPVINCIGYTHKNLPIAQNVSHEPSGTGAKKIESSLQSPSPPTKQEENENIHAHLQILLNVHMHHQYHLLFKPNLIKKSPPQNNSKKL